MKRKSVWISFFWPLIRPYKWYYLLMLQVCIVATFYPIIHNFSIKLLIDSFCEHKTLSYYDAFLPTSYFIGAQIILYISWRLNDFANLKVEPQLRKEIVCAVYSYLVNHSYNFFQRNFSGTLVSKVKGILDGYHNISKCVNYTLTVPVLKTVVSGVCLMLISKDLFMIIIIYAVIFIPLCLFFFKKLSNLRKRFSEDWHKLLGLISDKITNIFTQFAFSTRKRESRNLREYFDQHSIPLIIAWFKVDILFMLISPLLYWGMLVVIFLYLIQLRNAGVISIGDISFAISTAYLFSENIVDAAYDIKNFVQDYSDLKSSLSIIEEEQEVIDKESATELKVPKGEILYRNVYFGYDKKCEVLSDFTLHIPSGQKVGLVGHSGAGKSTVVYLLLKYFRINKGDIFIDSQSIYDVTSDSVRYNVALIPQDTLLFHQTIAENISYSNEGASIEEIINAAKIANIHEFIEALPEKYNTIVGERGIKLSGGQRQRISIARAILKNAPILVLDEATSSLDSQTEQQIQGALNIALRKNNSTVIAIAHRLSTIRHLDRIVVMDKGKIVEDGSFNELLSREQGVFKQLWNCQINGMVV